MEDFVANLTSNRPFKLDWGDPLVIRQALQKTLGYNFAGSAVLIESIGYTSHLGSTTLIEICKNLAERMSGKRPKHLVLTCGATGAIHAALYALKDHYTDYVVTNKRHFPIYPSIITTSGMMHINHAKRDFLARNGAKERSFISLVDSPSNPEGIVDIFGGVDIFDAAYASRTYTPTIAAPKEYKVMCGSLSKITGLSGLRLGWASTDDDEVAACMNRFVVANYVGLSKLSMDFAEEVLEVLDLDRFEIISAKYLDDNREEVQKILNKFSQGTVPTRGMFAILRLGKSEKRALERANVKWQPGSTWGEDDSWARLSLGQTRETTRAAVKAILK